MLSKFLLPLTIILNSFLIVSCNNENVVSSKSKPTSIIINKTAPKFIVKNSTIKRGHGFFQSLKYLGVRHKTSLDIINALRDEVEFSKLRVGDKLQAKFDSDNKLISFEYSNSPATAHRLKLVNDKFQYEFIERPTKWVNRVIEGELNKGSTLQADLISTGLKRSIVAEAINVLLCKVNFRMYARMGDKYKILLSERFYKDQIIDTKVLYTSYSGEKAGFSEAFFYDDGDKSTYTAHYTADGEALIRSGLRYPVRRLHIRSGYGMRRHPVTGRRTLHRGVDFRGRVGTPVYSVARGKVIESSYNKYAGNKVAIRHADRSISYYLHLNRKFVKKGDYVRTAQQIGTVGKTGRVTGPHLHFGFKNTKGRWMNPMHKRMIATPKLKGEKFANLTGQILKIENTLAYLEFKHLPKYVMAPMFNKFKIEHIYSRSMFL